MCTHTHTHTHTGEREREREREREESSRSSSQAGEAGDVWALLVWTDPAASPSALLQLVNDLNLLAVSSTAFVRLDLPFYCLLSPSCCSAV